MRLQDTNRPRGVREPGLERHPRGAVVTEGEPQRSDVASREGLADGDDVRLVWVATESVQNGAAADDLVLGKMQDAVEIDALDADRHALRGHYSGVAAFVTASGIASRPKTLWRSSIAARELISSSTFLRPFILPIKIAPTSLSPRKKSRL